MPRLSCLLLALAALALAPPARARPIISVPHFSQDIVVQPDGSSVQTVHEEVTTRDPAALRSVGRESVSYHSDIATLDITEAYTLKQDGTRHAVDPASIITRDVQGADFKGVTDLKARLVIFPDLEPGDTAVLTYRLAMKPMLAGQFMQRFPLPADADFGDARIRIHTPKGMVLRSRAENMVATSTESADGTVTEWQRTGKPRQAATLSVSSAPDYDTLAAAMAALVLPQARVTPPIQALADRLTAGITDPRAQTVALYDWVTTRIRYVDIELGIGGYQPHPAESVLANLYGDCKDHATLFAALLAAKGIASVPVSIGLAGPPYTLPDPPDLTWADHMITYLPALDLYVDTTQQFDSFGAMPMQEYGKRVLHLTASGQDAVHQVPVLTPEANTSRLRTEATLGADGSVTGSSTTAASGPRAFQLRWVQREFEKHGDKRQSALLLQQTGQGGTGRFAHGDYALTPDYTVKASFTLAPRPAWLTGTAFAPPIGLTLLPQPGNLLLGSPATASPEAVSPIPCWAGREEQEIVLHLPAGKKPAALPAPLDIVTKPLEYHAAWSMEGDALIVRRRFESRVDQPLCGGALRAEINRALVRIRAEQQRRVVLQDAGAPA